MSTSRHEHAQILKADIADLTVSPTTVTRERLADMREHLESYRQKCGRADSWKASLLAGMQGLAVLGAILAISFAGAAVLWAWQGMHSWWLVVPPCLWGPACVWLHRKLYAWENTASATRWEADKLNRLLKPWSKHDWQRAQIVRTLSEDAEAYYRAVTAEGTPVAFQLTALHRKENVLTWDDEFDLEEYGSCDAPRTALYLHQHPNWKPASQRR